MTTSPLRVCVALGVATMSLEGGRDREDDLATIRVAADAGVRVFDAARVYAPPHDPLYSEQLLAEALTGRDDVLIGTKGGHYRDVDGFHVDNSPRRLRGDVEDSLRALRTECLDLYYLHRADQETVPLEESVGALAELRQAGRLARVGVSNVTVDQLERARAVTGIDAVQNRHSVVGRESTQVLTRCQQLGIAFFAYSPLRADAPLASLLPRLAAVAAARGVALPRLAQRALLASSPVLSVVSGATRAVTVADSAAAAHEPWDEECQDAYRADLSGEAAPSVDRGSGVRRGSSGDRTAAAPTPGGDSRAVAPVPRGPRRRL